MRLQLHGVGGMACNGSWPARLQIVRSDPVATRFRTSIAETTRKVGFKQPGLQISCTRTAPGISCSLGRFGNDVTVVEMDGEIDMDNMESQLKDWRSSPPLSGLISLRSSIQEMPCHDLDEWLLPGPQEYVKQWTVWLFLVVLGC